MEKEMVGVLWITKGAADDVSLHWLSIVIRVSTWTGGQPTRAVTDLSRAKASAPLVSSMCTAHQSARCFTARQSPHVIALHLPKVTVTVAQS